MHALFTLWAIHELQYALSWGLTNRFCCTRLTTAVEYIHMEPEFSYLKNPQLVTLHTLYSIALVSLKILSMQTTSGFYGIARNSIFTLLTGKRHRNGTSKRMTNKASTYQGADEPETPRENNGCMSKGTHVIDIIYLLVELKHRQRFFPECDMVLANVKSFTKKIWSVI